jgi:hypothetical protein
MDNASVLSRRDVRPLSETYSERGIARSGHQDWKANLEPLRVFAR